MFCIITISVIINLGTIFHIQTICMFMLRLCTTLRLPSCSDSLIVSIKLKTRDTFCISCSVMFDKRSTLTEVAYVSKILLLSLQVAEIGGSGVLCATQECMFSMLLIQGVGN